MDIRAYSSKDIGNLGESVACEYLRRKGYVIKDRNVSYKTGELDIVAEKDNCLHIIEVKTLVCIEFPSDKQDLYDPGENLHKAKIYKVIRTADWYVATRNWEAEWQVNAALIWIRKRDGMARIRYILQIL